MLDCGKFSYGLENTATIKSKTTAAKERYAHQDIDLPCEPKSMLCCFNSKQTVPLRQPLLEEMDAEENIPRASYVDIPVAGCSSRLGV